MLGTRVRAVAVGICSLLFPGLGQALLRRWVRALLFAGLFISTLAIFLPESAYVADPTFESVMRATESMSDWGTIAVTVVQFAAMMDAYVQALQTHQQPTDGPTCPRCGREIDPTHGFCHWCTYEFEEPTTE
ncbi:zinc ribbon domain-containing protein [Halorubellus sp. JP-L1]|uniref:zinc ribbon domain-containing protein n=1 Tax=Halorubellus sp. JP-L1 TaxID=2715753 RepID=UPI00140A749D|nr:zinc ribbon domain-containing protein [Halorubellus sp. JP-L1]NHN42428.1 zinc ribbon domain-containing protein [Halorubellus sp. JP-L1]